MFFTRTDRDGRPSRLYLGTKKLSFCCVADEEAPGIAVHLDQLWARGDAKGVIRVATEAIRAAGQDQQRHHAIIYKYMGAGYHSTGHLSDAVVAFNNSIRLDPQDLQAWLLLGDTYLHQFRAREAVAVFEEAIVKRKLTGNLARLAKARTWIADWKDHDQLAAGIRRWLQGSMAQGVNPDVTIAEFTDVSNDALLWMTRHQRYSQDPTVTLPPLSASSPSTPALVPPSALRYRVGFVSSDLGVHPVSQLLRGMLTSIDKSRFEVVVYCLQAGSGWWRANISSGVEHMVAVHGWSTVDTATLVRSHHLQSLIDLNGHTLQSGLPILALRPAPLQFSFLGSPITTGQSGHQIPPLTHLVIIPHICCSVVVWYSIRHFLH